MNTAAGFAALMMPSGHLVRRQSYRARGGVGLTHADVNVGVDRVRAAGGRIGSSVTTISVIGAAGRRQPPRVVHDLRIGLVALGRRYSELMPIAAQASSSECTILLPSPR